MLEGTTATKRFEFCYGHHLPGYDGACCNQHGHNSIVEVEFEPTEFEKYKEMVIDFKKIKKYVGPLVEALDHRNLNDFFEIPTAEALVHYLVEMIQKSVPFGNHLIRLRLYETPDSFIEWRKPCK